MFLFVYFWISEKVNVIFSQQNLSCNGLSYIVHAKSADEFRLTLDPSIAQSEVWSPLIAETKLWTERLLSPSEKNDSTFWLIFDLSLNLGLFFSYACHEP